MARKNTNKNQESLSFDPTDLAARHDYGGQFDEGDEGHEFPFVQGDSEEVHSVSVSLREREETLRKIAKLYALKARVNGLEEAVKDPTERAKLRSRYGRELGRVVGNAKTKAHYTGSDERAILEPLLKTSELQAVGFDEADIDEAALTTTIDVRHSFGISVGDELREINLRKAAHTAKSARKPK